MKRARTDILDIAFEQAGPPDGFPILLLHCLSFDPSKSVFESSLFLAMESTQLRCIVNYGLNLQQLAIQSFRELFQFL